MSVKLRDPSFVRTTGRGKPKLQESTPMQLWFALFRDPSFVRTTGRGKPKVQESTPMQLWFALFRDPSCVRMTPKKNRPFSTNYTLK
ncbi:hypothetical protein [Sphingobacterium sp.]|uniref:hypothetical protein n=1 Tax=Sphingobacterium sp. TaxID=341027 RepID=UPI0028AA7F1D|nr:hypothetical protein [Sphingobacterium sp.]